MNEELNEKKLETVTGGIDVPSYPPVKCRCVKCGREYMIREDINLTKLHCPVTSCHGTLVKVRDE